MVEAPGDQAVSCHCGHSKEEHGHDSRYFGSSACTECGCIAYETDDEADEITQPILRQKQLISSDEATPAKTQHKRPCSDCPFARTALPGWLGSDTAEEWMTMVHGETRIECHTLIGAQCAGAAIYRSNVYKRVQSGRQLHLLSDRVKVFATPSEFLKHHANTFLPKKKPRRKRI